MRISRRVQRGERGAVLVVVAAFTVVAVMFLAFVIDIGDQRQNRRQLTAGTDSPALAVAQEWALAGADPAWNCDSTSTDDHLAAANNPRLGEAPTSYNCTFSDVTPFRGGVVTVQSRERVDYAFGGVTGVDSSSTGSSTSVRIQPVPGGGVRPVAVCSEDFGFDPSIWTAAGDGVFIAPSTSATTVTFTNTRGNSSNPCRTNGNWSQVIFRANNDCPGTSNASGGAGTFNDQYANGSPYDVAVNDCVSRLPGNGGFSSGNPRLIEGMTVSFPVFDEAVGGGAGIYRVTGFLEASVVRVTHVGNTTSFQLRPLRYITKGTCCLLNAFNSQIEMCDTGTIGGAANTAASTRCRPRNTSANPGDPGFGDPCLVTDVQPQATTAPVDTSNRLESAKSFTVSVVDAARCGSLSLTAVSDSPATTATSALINRVGNTYTFEFAIGTPLAASGTMFQLEVHETTGAGKVLLDDEATMRTVGGCVITAVSVAPSRTPPAFRLQTGTNAEKLAEDITFTVSVADRSACTGLTAWLREGTTTRRNPLTVADGPSPTTMIARAAQHAGDYKPDRATSSVWHLVLTGPSGAPVYPNSASVTIEKG